MVWPCRANGLADILASARDKDPCPRQGAPVAVSRVSSRQSLFWLFSSWMLPASPVTMRLTFVLLLNASLASAGTLYRRQDGPVAPGTATDCTYYDTARSERYTCAFFEENWGLTHEQFVDYASPFLPNYRCPYCFSTAHNISAFRTPALDKTAAASSSATRTASR